MTRRPRLASRRGAAIISVVIVLAILGVALVGAVHAGGRQQELTIRRMDTLRAFYAAEAGMNIAIREIITGTDEDGDGVVGGVSDDGDDQTGVVIGRARVSVARTSPGGIVTLTSEGISGLSRRRLEISLSSG